MSIVGDVSSMRRVMRPVAIGGRGGVAIDRKSLHGRFISFHLALSLAEAAANQLRV